MTKASNSYSGPRRSATATWSSSAGPEGFDARGAMGRRPGWCGGTSFRCGSCDQQVSVTAGTIFHGSRSSLLVWFKAMWYVTNQRFGVSALGLQKELDLGSYHTAWA